MAKKTKELNEDTKKKETTKKGTSEKKSTTIKKVKASTTTKKSLSSAKKDNTKKTSTSKKGSTTKTKSTTSKKTASTTKKSVSSKKTAISQSSETFRDFQPEYYDLPYSYNKTVVKILAQTPKTLFVYWEISEDDRKRFQKSYGDKFFEETKPVLIVYNATLNYSFEIDINDFANSWYIHINDSNCVYSVELGRKPLPFVNTKLFENNTTNEEHKYIPYYVYISSSNNIESPNNHIMYDFSKQFVQFRNIKTGEIIYKEISGFKFFTNLGIMKIDEIYKYLYPNENLEYENFVGNPSSSGLTSSGTFSSKF